MPIPSLWLAGRVTKTRVEIRAVQHGANLSDSANAKIERSRTLQIGRLHARSDKECLLRSG